MSYYVDLIKVQNQLTDSLLQLTDTNLIASILRQRNLVKHEINNIKLGRVEGQRTPR